MRLELRPYQRPFRNPLHTAHGLWSVREGILLRLTNDEGHSGYGEIAPIPWFGTETLAQALAFCQSLESDFWQNRVTLTEADIPPHLPATQFGIASAWANLQRSRTFPPLPLSPSSPLWTSPHRKTRPHRMASALGTRVSHLQMENWRSESFPRMPLVRRPHHPTAPPGPFEIGC